MRPLTKKRKAAAIASMALGGSGGITGVRMAVDGIRAMPEQHAQMKTTAATMKRTTAARKAARAEAKAGTIRYGRQCMDRAVEIEAEMLAAEQELTP